MRNVPHRLQHLSFGPHLMVLGGFWDTALLEEGFEGLSSLTISSSLCFMSMTKHERSQCPAPASMPVLAAMMDSYPFGTTRQNKLSLISHFCVLSQQWKGNQYEFLHPCTVCA